MEEFLGNWETFDRLVSEHHSGSMLEYWQQVKSRLTLTEISNNVFVLLRTCHCC